METANGLQVKILSSSTGATLETVVNNWIDTQSNSGADISIKYVTMCEGTISDTINIAIFYNSDYTLS